MKFNKIFILVFFLLICCKNKEKDTVDLIINKEIKESNNFDSILKCGYFSDNGSYFVTADKGCIYNEESDNVFGNLIIYLIANDNKKHSEDYVNKLKTSTLKEEFSIYIYVIPKEYLVDTPEGLYQKEKYIEKLYTFNKDTKKWEIIDLIEINNIEENLKEQNWRENFINNCIDKNAVLGSIEKSNDFELNGNYFIKSKVLSIETGSPIEVSFSFYFERKLATLSIRSDNSLEVYCEGTYSIDYNKNNVKLEYTGEGICTSDKNESTFLIKKENNQYLIKSKRFENEDWQILNEE
jgi:hypothetical protein